jgi:hypothetical protein
LRDSRGRYFLVSHDRYGVLVFDSTGRFNTAFGRRGGGPGEFSQITRMALSPGDSLFVIQSRKISVFSPSLTFVRTYRLPTGTSFNAPPPGRARGEADEIWTAQPYRYILEGRRESGSLFARVAVVGSTWFDTTDAKPRRGPGERPGTRLVAAHVVAANTIAVYGRRTSEAWRSPAEFLTPALVGGKRIAVRPAGDVDANRAQDRENDTFIDIIDLSRRAIVATARFREQSLQPMGRNLAYSRRVDADGIVHVDIWRLVVRR